MWYTLKNIVMLFFMASHIGDTVVWNFSQNQFCSYFRIERNSKHKKIGKSVKPFLGGWNEANVETKGLLIISFTILFRFVIRASLHQWYDCRQSIGWSSTMPCGSLRTWYRDLAVGVVDRGIERVDHERGLSNPTK